MNDPVPGIGAGHHDTPIAGNEMLGHEWFERERRRNEEQDRAVGMKTTVVINPRRAEVETIAGGPAEQRQAAQRVLE